MVLASASGSTGRYATAGGRSRVTTKIAADSVDDATHTQPARDGRADAMST